MSVDKKTTKTKDLGLFLIVEEGKEEFKHVFYRAYFNIEEIYEALEKDENLKKLIRDLKAIDLVTINIGE